MGREREGSRSDLYAHFRRNPLLALESTSAYPDYLQLERWYPEFNTRFLKLEDVGVDDLPGTNFTKIMDIWHMNQAAYVLQEVFRRHVSERNFSGGKVPECPLERIGIVGPPVGKSPLVITLREMFGYSDFGLFSYHFLDEFSSGDQFAIEGKPGWVYGGTKRDPEKEIPDAVRFLGKLREFRDAKSMVAIADTPGKLRNPAEWFYDFYIHSFTKVFVLGRSLDEIYRFAGYYQAEGIKVISRGLVIDDQERAEVDRLLAPIRYRPGYFLMYDFNRRTNPFNPASIYLADALLRETFYVMLDKGIIYPSVKVRAERFLGDAVRFVLSLDNDDGQP